MGDVAGNGREVALFCPDVTDATTLKRVQQFQDQGYLVTVFGFRRERYNRDYTPAWPHVPLGETSDGRYGQRLWALLRALPAVVSNRRRVGPASIIYARNIDQLVLALLARRLVGSAAPIAYEVLDIPPILTGRSVSSRMLRALERYCMRRIRTLVLSSPGFHRHYYAAYQKFAGDWFLLENKLHPSIMQAPAPVPGSQLAARARRAQRRWKVAYFGLIRGDDTFALMTRLAARLRDRVEFQFRGVLTTVDEAKFLDALSRHRNMRFEGPYLPHEDLGRLYGDVDFAWALDLEHTDHNSRWLLPCRFYEAGYFGVPSLAVRGFEVGDMIERLGTGWTFGDPLEESLYRFFDTLDPAEYEARRERLASRPRGDFVAGDEITALCANLDERWSRTGSPVLADQSRSAAGNMARARQSATT
ncbi:MAG TPA: hypothetical protein VJ890_04720 [Vineibacter sp.]|nr:hypothetical protein [Vineibacter sp.]